MNEDQIRQIAQAVYDDNNSRNQYGVSLIPAHQHTGTDSLPVSYTNLSDRTIMVNHCLPGTFPATAGDYSIFFIASAPCHLMSASEVHAVKGTDLGAVTLQIERLTGTVAPGSGVLLLSTVSPATAFDLKGTINTVQNATVLPPSTGTTGTSLITGDRLALKLTGTPTSVANLVVSVVLGF